MVLEVYDKETNKTVDVKKDSYFKDYGVVIGLDGHFIIVENGCVEVYSRDDFVPTPMSNNLASCK